MKLVLKKVFILVLATVTLLVPAVTCFSFPDGDVNHDGTVDIADVVKVLRFSVQLDTPTSADLTKADVAPLDAQGNPQGDGTIDISDVLLVLKRSLNILNWSVTPVRKFAATGSMTSVRVDQSSTLLNSGDVLVAGGFDAATTTLKSAELYIPATGVFAATGSMTTARYFYGASLLDTGSASDKVLFTGGLLDNSDGTQTHLASAELYSPTTGTYTATTGSLNQPREDHTSTWLPSVGKVLIVGGVDANGTPTNTAELYDPATDSFTSTGNMTLARKDHQATLLSDGKVLITGGDNATSAALDIAEIYNPATGIFTIVTSQMTTPRQDHKAVLLGDGTVLLVGGGDANNFLLKSAEIYNPQGQVFVPTGSLSIFRDLFNATALSDGTVLVNGGEADGAATNSAEVYDPATGVFTQTGSMVVPREEQASTLLKTGKVLVTGGSNSSPALSSAELF